MGRVFLNMELHVFRDVVPVSIPLLFATVGPPSIRIGDIRRSPYHSASLKRFRLQLRRNGSYEALPSLTSRKAKENHHLAIRGRRRIKIRTFIAIFSLFFFSSARW